MIDRSHDLPVTRQAKALNVSQGSVYHMPRPVSEGNLAIMRRIDELHLDCPFAGSRMLRDMLCRDGIQVGRRHVATLMKRMGIEAIYRRPNTSKLAPGQKIYPYLLRGLAVNHPNQVWAMEAAFCIEAVEEALAKYGKPDIFNNPREGGGQGSQFTSAAFTGVLLNNAIAISMDGKGSWRDNVFVERIWKSVKYEEVYLKAYAGVSEARSSIGRYLDFYNRRRPHSSLDRRTPDEAYFDHLPQRAAA